MEFNSHRIVFYEYCTCFHIESNSTTLVVTLQYTHSEHIESSFTSIVPFISNRILRVQSLFYDMEFNSHRIVFYEYCTCFHIESNSTTLVVTLQYTHSEHIESSFTSIVPIFISNRILRVQSLFYDMEFNSHRIVFYEYCTCFHIGSNSTTLVVTLQY
ncbi:hypothetical protein CEXT_602861 [Caerostris extrusa]|uniref:Uncharacterized protein n=1 Tax=Caerostris extrusa TaxID=172846 RepID=A0AAV4R298_CAEEX|nr:hypothetical protein CEXT_602861 [Caerostris extrusa]